MSVAEQTLKLNISGMTCDHCAEAVLRSLHAVPGVKFAEVYLEPGYADVRFDDSIAQPDDFKTAVEMEGYEASLA